MNRQYGFALKPVVNMEPLGKLDILQHTAATLVTTCEILQDPMTAELKIAYTKDGVRFEAVGPLLDKEGARRAAGHRLTGACEHAHAHADGEEVLRRVCAARAVG